MVFDKPHKFNVTLYFLMKTFLFDFLRFSQKMRKPLKNFLNLSISYTSPKFLTFNSRHPVCESYTNRVLHTRKDA